MIEETIKEEKLMLFRFVPLTNNHGMSILIDRKTTKCYQPNGEPIICSDCKRTAIMKNSMITCPINHPPHNRGGFTN